MYDTIVIVTEQPPAQGWQALTEQLQARYGVNAGTGEVDYTHYTATLSIPISASTVRLQVRTSKWITHPGESSPRKVDGLWSLRLECSLHKATRGHNCFDGPRRLNTVVSWLLSYLSEQLECTLPSSEHWTIRRLDVAEAFDLDSLDNVRGWIRAKSLIAYPRRTVHFWGDLGLSTTGSTTTLRAYAKGPQLASEGGISHLAMVYPPEMCSHIQERANRVLRAECEIKAPVWDKTPTTVPALSDEWAHQYYDEQWRKFLRPPEDGARRHHTATAVEQALQYIYPVTWLDLYRIWCTLATRGEQWYRLHVDARTWRRQRDRLEHAEVAWLDTDVVSLARHDYLDFSPTLDSPQRIA